MNIWLEKNYDRILLSAVCVAALWFSMVMVRNSASFKERFVQDRPQKRTDIGETKTEEVKTVAQAMSQKLTWGVNLMPPNKPVYLNVSVPLVESKGKVFDMAVDNGSLLRSPVPNTWLLKNNVRFLREDCLSLDPDKDGFSNLEEWKGVSDPKDAGSHPPFTDKLVMVERFEVPYKLVFGAAIEPQFQIQRVEPKPKRSWFVERDGNFEEEERFTLIDYTQKMVEDPNLGKKDASELLLMDNLWQEEFVLVKGQIKNLPTYYAIFEYRLQGKAQFQVKKGDNFKLPNDPTISYILSEVTEDGAEIRKTGEENGAESIMISRVR